MYEAIGFLASILGWLILIYIGWRNQRAAVDSPLVDDSNFGPRLASIVEVSLHPDHAAKWLVQCSEEEAELTLIHSVGDLEVVVYLKPVFPNMGKDSSEIHGIRKDDGK
jgi:hypothetical protein